MSFTFVYCSLSELFCMPAHRQCNRTISVGLSKFTHFADCYFIECHQDSEDDEPGFQVPSNLHS